MKHSKVEKDSKKKKKKRWKKIMTKISDLDKQVQKLAKDLTANSARSEELAKQVEAASKEIKSFGQDLAANQEVAEILAKTVETSNARIQSLVNEIALYKAEVERQLRSSDSKNNGFSSLSENLTDTNQKLETVRTELSGFSEMVPALRSDIKGVCDKLGEHDAWISDAKSRIEMIANDSIPGLARQLESFEKQFDELGRRFRAVSESVEGMAPKLEAVSNGSGGAGETEVKLDMIIQRLDTLEKNLANNGTRIGELQDGASSLAKRLKSVETDVFAASASMTDQF